MLEPGHYFGMLTEGGMDAIGDKKTPLMRLTYSVAHKVLADGENEELPQAVNRDVNVFLTDGAWPYSQQKLAGLGFNGNFDEPQWSEDATGNWTELVCEHQTYEGKTREVWSLAAWGGRAERTPPAKDVMRKLSARWKTASASTQAPAGRPTPPPRPMPEPPGPEEVADPEEYVPAGDDIPF